MLDKLLEQGIALEDVAKPETLVTLRTKYESLVTSLEGEKSKAETEGDSLLKQITSLVSTEGNLEQMAILKDCLRSTIWQAIDENEQLSVLIVDLLQEIKAEVLGERDFHLARVKRMLAPAKVADDAFTDGKEEAAELAELIRAVFTLVKSNLPKTKAFKDAFPLKERMEDDGNGNRNVPTGDFLPKLSKLPRTPGESAPVGRGATTRRLRFAWNGDEIPTGTLFHDVAHDYVSDRKIGFVVDPKAISDAVVAAGFELFSETPWTVEFPTGTLRGWLPKKA